MDSHGDTSPQDSDEAPSKATITEEVGDIFDSPPGSILIHACNTQGVWGKGVAAEFKKRYPQAFQQYHSFCTRTVYMSGGGRGAGKIGKAILIPPSEAILGKHKRPPSEIGRCYVACLMTSVGYGNNVDRTQSILIQTEKALYDLAAQIKALQADQAEAEQELQAKLAKEQDSQYSSSSKDDDYDEYDEELTHIKLGGCRAVRLNSGEFGVPWHDTKRVLQDGPLDIVVVRREGEPLEPGEEDEDVKSDDDDGDEDSEEEEEDIDSEEDVDGPADHGDKSNAKPTEKTTPRRGNPGKKAQPPANLNPIKRGRPLKAKGTSESLDKVASNGAAGGSKQTNKATLQKGSPGKKPQPPANSPNTSKPGRPPKGTKRGFDAVASDGLVEGASRASNVQQKKKRPSEVERLAILPGWKKL